MLSFNAHWRGSIFSDTSLHANDVYYSVFKILQCCVVLSGKKKEKGWWRACRHVTDNWHEIVMTCFFPPSVKSKTTPIPNKKKETVFCQINSKMWGLQHFPLLWLSSKLCNCLVSLKQLNQTGISLTPNNTKSYIPS